MYFCLKIFKILWTKSIHRFLVFVYLSSDKESQGLNVYGRTWSIIFKNQFFKLGVWGGTEIWYCEIHETGECWLLIVPYSPVQMYFYVKSCCLGYFSLSDRLILKKSQIPVSDLMLIQEVNGQKWFDSKKTFWKTITRQLFIRPQRSNFMGRILDKTKNTEHTLNKVSTPPLISLIWN